MIRTLEYIWLFMAIFGVSGILYKLLRQEEVDQMGFMVIFTTLAIVMYLYRRKTRINMDRAKAEDTSDKYH